MSKTSKRGLFSIVLDNLGWPVFWGGLACVGFYALVFRRVIESEMITRYFATHPVQYLETALFAIGVAAILSKALNVVGQFGTLPDIELLARPPVGQPVEDAAGMVTSLDELPGYLRSSYLARRLRQALEFVGRKKSAHGLDEELKHLADLDAARQHEGYGLVRIIIWATPMLGFLGTVIGITLALADLSPQALVSSPETAMEGLLAGLSVAFDTTALALTLSIVLMFCQYVTSRVEIELLEAVDARVADELVGRFQDVGTAQDPHVASISRMQERVLQGVEQLVHRQADIWRETLSSAQENTTGLLDQASARIETALEKALRQSARQHASELTRAEESARERAEVHWDQLQEALTENARVMQAQQGELVKQGDIMLKVIDAVGEISHLQQVLNDNLDSVSVAGKLDETIVSLSTAISLLNVRLGSQREDTPSVQLLPKAPRSKAA